MARKKKDLSFSSISVSGAMLPPDLLAKISDLNKNAGKDKIPGLSPESYHLPEGSKLNEAIARSWAVVQAHWKSFSSAKEELAADEQGTSVTNERWLLPLFKELEYGRLTTADAPVIDEKPYPIKRFYNNSPIHLIGCNLPLDKRTKGAAGAAKASPHAMVQEFLNRSDDHLWAFLSNGLQLRILRDNVSLSRQAFVEFDLEAMMNGEIYADFALMWLLCHQSRVEADRQDDCWLETWSKLAREAGTRVLKDLREGVQNAIEALGRGFVGHPRNDQLRAKLQESGTLSKDDFYRQLLRVVYRLLFLFVAEDRGLLHPEDADESACELYDSHYSTRRLRDMSDKLRGSKHADLWHSLSLVFARLESEGCPQLGLIGLGSFLWRQDSTTDLLGPAQSDEQQEAVLITNDDLLTAIRALAFVEQEKTRRAVDYKNLGSEELGSVYESLLELHPEINAAAKQFDLKTAAGNERKTTGSYYTPDLLVQCLLDSALDPVVKDRLSEAKRISRADANPNSFPDWFTRLPEDQQPTLLADGYSAIAEQALLALKVCDPACGSGHFLIAAAHRLAGHLSRVRTGESEASLIDYQHALRDVISRCIYGVDINPMAVELCKVSLWMEAIDPGRPLSFLDHHIQCGNSLLGTTPALLADGIPDNAFKAIEGDDKAVVKGLKADNKRERKEHADQTGQQQTMFGSEPIIKLGNLPASFASLTSSDEFTITDVAEKEELYNKLVSGSNYQNAQLLADTWCAAFVWKKDETDLGRQCPTEAGFRKVEKSANHSVMPHVIDEVTRLAGQYQFFHWHLAFPDVFVLPEGNDTADNDQTGWNRGFDVVLGNPPWERIKFQDKEWFTTREPKIADAKTPKERKKLIQQLEVGDPKLFAEYTNAARDADGEANLIRQSGRYPLCGRGSINLFAVFAEGMTQTNSNSGRVGCIVQSDIATSESCKQFFQHVMDRKTLVSFFDFVNTEGIFPGIHRTHPHFCLLTLRGREDSTPAVFSFWNTQSAHIQDESRKYFLSKDEIKLVNPNNLTCPVFRSRRDAELCISMYRNVPALRNEGTDEEFGWDPFYLRIVDYSDHADDLVLTNEERNGESDKEFVPVFESKLFHSYDQRYATYLEADKVQQFAIETKKDPFVSATTKFLFPTQMFEGILGKYHYERPWTLAIRELTNSTNERTTIACVLPRVPSFRNTTVVLGTRCKDSPVCLAAQLNSFVFDFIARQSVSGTHLSFTLLKQLPCLTPSRYASKLFEEQGLAKWITSKVLELTYTAWDLEAFALDCGYDGPPFKWDEKRRFDLRCELDAAYFHLYLGSPNEWGTNSLELREMFPTPRDAVEYIMETFPIVKRKDIKRTQIENEEGEITQEGTYITRDTILAIYDQMQNAIETGVPYQTQLNPAPGPPTRDGSDEFLPFAEWNEFVDSSHIHAPKEETTSSETTRRSLVFPLPATREQFPETPVEILACGVLVDLLIRLPGAAIQDYREMLGLVLSPENVRKLSDPADRDALAACIGSLPDSIASVNGNEPSWSEVFWTLEGNDSLESVEFGDAISLQPGSAAEEVRDFYGCLPEDYMTFATTAIKRYQETVIEYLTDDDRADIESAKQHWATATES